MKAVYHTPVPQSRPEATFDASFWVHAVYLNLVDSMLQDFTLAVTTEVEDEIGEENPTGQRTQGIGGVQAYSPGRSFGQSIALYGDGERAAINLALERGWLLLIDDWRPAEAARASGLTTMSSILYVVRLFDEGRRTAEEVLDAMAFMVRRNSIRNEYLLSALNVVAEIRRRRGKQRP
jgi:predicted nucleic acid-binding protein